MNGCTLRKGQVSCRSRCVPQNTITSVVCGIHHQGWQPQGECWVSPGIMLSNSSWRARFTQSMPSSTVTLAVADGHQQLSSVAHDTTGLSACRLEQFWVAPLPLVSVVGFPLCCGVA